MSTLTIRDFPEDAHAALKVMVADEHGGGRRRSVEDLARALLVDATLRRGPGLGTQLAAIGRQFQASQSPTSEPLQGDEVHALFKRPVDRSEPASFE